MVWYNIWLVLVKCVSSVLWCRGTGCAWSYRLFLESVESINSSVVYWLMMKLSVW